MFFVIFRWKPEVEVKTNKERVIFVSPAAQGNSIAEVARWFEQIYQGEFRQLLSVIYGSQEFVQEIATYFASKLQATGVENIRLNIVRTTDGKLISTSRLPDVY